ncbi:ankyrin repeat and zinc finger domain-containing protein 1 [Xiphophorus couchianus]|uniref:ankyrin repeat and zinc finger domain-containing protein 1 n=1 Tax=Xiphophorus couchianus TaxID=32473 RepID=UPI0010161092|nr:ankyrin repeat and zinc finger domain-containing protein 1 [Xiphophorus couchianus]XP_027879612.1 ankyrin repeat and zinc finger domain-containing protein 1 [Xiphophorus couchianus]
MTTCTDLRSIFDLCSNEEAFKLTEVNSVLKETGSSTDCVTIRGPHDDWNREVSDKMACSACKCSFDNREEQREHYKLDWHRFNLRQKMAGLLPITAEEFEKKTRAGDLSSISGSESDSDGEDMESDGRGTGSNITGTDNESSAEPNATTGRLNSKVVFQNAAGEYLSIYRCALMGKADSDEHNVVSSLNTVNQKTVWVILMTGGGHFAGAVFEGKQVLDHKTFHRYTVRAKRGTAQGLRDSQNRSHMARSAGATLRRYNEAALVKDIQDLLLTWAEHLNRASAVFVRAPSYNKAIFFGGRGGALQKNDLRVRSLPIATRRATFREVQRVHEVLSTVQVYGKDADMSAVFSPTKTAWKKKPKAAAQKITGEQKDILLAPGEENNESSDEEGEEIQLEMVELTIGTLDLREHEMHPCRRRKRRRKKKEQGKLHNQETGSMNAGASELEDVVSKATPAEEEEETPHQEQSVKTRKKKPQGQKQLDEAVDESVDYGLRDALFTACKVGDVGALCSLLQLPQETMDHPEKMEENISTAPLSLLNKPIDSSGFSLLHVAAAAAQKAVVRLLLHAGADPACRDNKGQTPYTVAPDKDTRNVFRKYMGENPDKYDYSKAQVPGPLTAETESKKVEKKKAQRAQRKHREKEQKEEKRKQELEAEEKKKFASLTDREKRALAAEKRLAEQAVASGVSLSNVQRCWSCGESLLGKIPFNYLEYTFCTPRCVQAHRKANAPPNKS